MHFLLHLFFAIWLAGTIGAVGDLLTRTSKFFKCPDIPPQAVNFVWNPTYFDAQGEYFPLMMPDFALVTSSMFKPNATLNDFRQLGCYRVNPVVGNVTARSTTGFRVTVDMNCPRFTPPKWIPTCTFDEPFEDYDHISWVVATDNKSWGLATRCWNNEIYTWNVFSSLPVLAEATKKEILAKVEQLGFNKQEYVTLDYTKCCACV